jgi:hypothetical protein
MRLSPVSCNPESAYSFSLSAFPYDRVAGVALLGFRLIQSCVTAPSGKPAKIYELVQGQWVLQKLFWIGGRG